MKVEIHNKAGIFIYNPTSLYISFDGTKTFAHNFEKYFAFSIDEIGDEDEEKHIVAMLYLSVDEPKHGEPTIFPIYKWDRCEISGYDIETYINQYKRS